MTIELFFPTPVYYEIASPEVHKKIKAEYKKAEKAILKNVKPKVWGDNIEASYGTVINLFSEYKLPALEEFIRCHVSTFSKTLYTVHKDYEFTESWVNYYHKGQYQNVHIHPHAKISGVYYMQTNGADGNLRFHPPGYSFRYDEGYNTNLTHNTMAHQPQEGKLILFPSFAPHSVQPNMTDDVRISISFNVVS